MNKLINKQEALAIFCQLVGMDAETGNEAKLANRIISIVTLLFPGVTAIYDNAHQRFGDNSGSIGNLFINIPGTIPGRPTVGLNAHLDRVKPGNGIKPIIHEDRVTSSGDTILAADDVAGIAAILSALGTISDNNLDHSPIQLIFTVSEEVKIRGARYMDTSLIQASEIFSFDGEESNVVYRGACASQKYRITITGKLAHAGLEPEKGVSAPLVFALALYKLREEGLFGNCRDSQAVTNFNVAGFNEVGTNSVQDKLVVTGEARSFDNDELDIITGRVREIFLSATTSVISSKGVRAKINFEVDEAYHAFELLEDHPTVVRAAKAIRATGLEPTTLVVRGGLDASWLNRHGIPTVCLGMGCHKPHTDGEYLLLDEFYQACEVALTLALGE